MRPYRVGYRVEPQGPGQPAEASVIVDAGAIWHAPFQAVKLARCGMGDVCSVVEATAADAAAERAARAAAERRDPGPLADGPFVQAAPAREPSPAAAKWAPKRSRRGKT